MYLMSYFGQKYLLKREIEVSNVLGVLSYNNQTLHVYLVTFILREVNQFKKVKEI